MAIGTAFERSYSFQQSLTKCSKLPRAYLQQSVTLIQACHSLVKSSEVHRRHSSKEIERIIGATTTAIDAALQSSSECDMKFSKAKEAIVEILKEIGGTDETGESSRSFESKMELASSKDGKANVKLKGVKEKIVQWKKKAESASRTAKVQITFNQLHSPVSVKSVTPGVILEKVPNLGEVILWMYNSMADEKIALHENPHFYLDLPRKPEAYHSKFIHSAVDWAKLPQKSNYDVSILVDRKCHIFVENEEPNRTFGNIWKVAQNNVVLKDISGDIMSSEIVKQRLAHKPLEISARIPGSAAPIAKDDAQKIQNVDSLFEQALQDNNDWLIQIPSGNGVSQRRVAEQWVQVFPQPLTVRTDRETLAEDDAGETFYTPMAAFSDSGYSSDTVSSANARQGSSTPSSDSHPQTPRGSTSAFPTMGKTTSHQSWSPTSHRQTTSLGQPSQSTSSSVTHESHRPSVSNASTAGSSASRRSQSTTYHQQTFAPTNPGQPPRSPLSNGANPPQARSAASRRDASSIVSTQSITFQQQIPLPQPPAPDGAKQIRASTPNDASDVAVPRPSTSYQPQPTASQASVASGLRQAAHPPLSDEKFTEVAHQIPGPTPTSSPRPQPKTSHPQTQTPQPSTSQLQAAAPSPSSSTSQPQASSSSPETARQQQSSGSGWWGLRNTAKAIYRYMAG